MPMSALDDTFNIKEHPASYASRMGHSRAFPRDHPNARFVLNSKRLVARSPQARATSPTRIEVAAATLAIRFRLRAALPSWLSCACDLLPA